MTRSSPFWEQSTHVLWAAPHSRTSGRKRATLSHPLFDREFCRRVCPHGRFCAALGPRRKIGGGTFFVLLHALRDHDGSVVGLFGACIETTEKFCCNAPSGGGARATAAPFRASARFHHCHARPRPSGRVRQQRPSFRLQQPRLDRKTYSRSLSKHRRSGFFELLDGVLRSGEGYEAQGAKVRYSRTAAGPLETRYLTFMYAPLHDDAWTSQASSARASTSRKHIARSVGRGPWRRSATAFAT